MPKQPSQSNYNKAIEALQVIPPERLRILAASWAFLRPHIPALFGHPEEAIDDSVERDLRHMADLSEQVLTEAGD